jgi:predicted permease
VVLALWGTDVIIGLAPKGIPRADAIHVDGVVLAFSVLVTAVTGTIFGLIPAWSASRVDVQEALRAVGRTASAGRHPRRVRRALVVAETALALGLVTAAALITRSFTRVVDVDPGFRTDDVLSLKVALPAGPRERHERWFVDALARLAALPGVTHVGAIDNLPFRDGTSDRLIDIEGQPTDPARRPFAEIRIVAPGYFETMGIPVRVGRAPAVGDRAGAEPVMVVSQSFAQKHWPDGDALGHRLRLASPQGPWVRIVGVVGDVHQVGLDQAPLPTMYVPVAQSEGANALVLVVRGAVPMAQLGRDVRAELQRLDPQQPIFDLRPMSDRARETLEPRRFVLVLFELFAALALALAALGLYGLLAHAVAERQREIGVRVALGATRTNVVALIAREGAVLVGVGAALGLAAGAVGARLLAHFLYEVSAADPAALAAAIGLLVVAAALAMWLPLRRALRVDPMVALRDE